MDELFSRNTMYWGENVQKTLKTKYGIVFGLGGVGGYSAEALIRAGIGKLTIVDFDEVSQSNINRQLIALHSTIGIKKTTLFEKRLKDINPNAQINIFNEFYDETKNDKVFEITPDFVIDAIDTQKAKINLLIYCKNNNIPVFSSMGAGNRIDPTQLFIGDISEANTLSCKFSKNIVYNLKKCGIENGITCVFSKEPPKKPLKKIVNTIKTNEKEIKKYSPSSTPFVPPVAGYYLAFCAINKIINSIDKKIQ